MRCCSELWLYLCMQMQKIISMLIRITYTCIFCTTPSFSTIPNTFYHSVYDNAAVYLGSRTNLYNLDISCDTNFTTVFTTVTLDVTVFISSYCLARNPVCSILAHIISNFKKWNVSFIHKSGTVFNPLYLQQSAPWYFRTTRTFHISRKEFTFIFLVVWITFVSQ